MEPRKSKSDFDFEVDFRQEKTEQFLDDWHLWRSFKSGSESAFIKIYEAYFEVLLNYGYQLTGNEEFTQDAIQDLFIDIRDSRERLGDTHSIKFYMMKSLKRKLIRESARWYNQCIQIKEGFPFEATFSHEKVLIDRQIDEEQSLKLDKAVRDMSGRKKEALYYFYYEGLSYGQIQEIMELAHIKSARNLVYEGISYLRSVLK